MKLKYIPVLHARTYNIDFRTNKLLVEPKFFNEEDSRYIHSLALETTIQRELSPKEGRYVVYGCEKYAIVGRTVRFMDLYKAVGRDAKYSVVDKENGRLAYGFVGMMIPNNVINCPFELTDELILDVYENAIKDRWDETYTTDTWNESKKSDFSETEVNLIEYPIKNDLLSLKKHGQVLIEDDEHTRLEIVYAAMALAFNNVPISLCTSLETNKGTSFKFDIVTCKNVANSYNIYEAVNQINTDKDTNGQKYQLNSDDFQRDIAFTERAKKSHDKVPSNEPSFIDSEKNKKSVKSLDDVVSENSVPSDDNFFQDKIKKTFGIDKKDIGFFLGTALGITFIVIEIAKHAHPAVVAITATGTVILTGIEAKRIISKLK